MTNHHGDQPIAELTEQDATVLVVSVLIISACSIVYELLISALSSYFLGSSVLHFSLTIGLFLFFMGIGSFLSRFVHQDLLSKLIGVEIGVGLLGGLSGLVLYAAYSLTEFYYLIALMLIAGISILVGLEIPLLTRLLERSQGLKLSLSRVLSFDYMGALVASVLFPIVLVPYLGLQRTGLAVGLLNLAVAAGLIIHFGRRLDRQQTALTLATTAVAFVLVGGLFGSFRLVGFLEQQLYQDPVVFAEQTPYQRVVMTQHGKDLRLYLNGSIQFSSIDEYRYHEPLVHLPMAYAPHRSDVLVLGGGDGLAIRELLRYDTVSSITLVDLDPAVTQLGTHHALLRQLNGDALADPRVTTINQDAWRFLEQQDQLFSVIIIDLPDPSTLDLGKLYSHEFYQLAYRRLAADGLLVTQSSSPFFARQVFWSIHATLAEVFPYTLPYRSYVPSFGLWGYNLASKVPLDRLRHPLPADLKFVDVNALPSLLHFGSDVSATPAEVNRLENQVLVQYYEKSWDQ